MNQTLLLAAQKKKKSDVVGCPLLVVDHQSSVISWLD
jgi:hypothetical protein